MPWPHVSRAIFFHLAVGVAALLSAVSVSGQTNYTCDQAVDIHSYVLETLLSCENPTTQNSPVCELIGEAIQDNNTTGSDNAVQNSDQLYLVYNPLENVSPWQNYLIQSSLKSVADIGEVSYILNPIQTAYENLNMSNADTIDYYGPWQSAWWSQADYLTNAIQSGTNGWDDRSKMHAYWKIANYLFTGNWPLPFGEQAIARSALAVDALKAGLNLHPTWKNIYFNVTFSNGTTTAQLPAFFVTPDATKELPLVILTTGTDYTKEETFLSFAFEYLERGYSVLAYEGPGQGMVLKKPPFMPFFAQWEDVLLAILDFAEENLTPYIQIDKIVQNGLSLGGYLGTRGCAIHSDRLAACLPNPPQYSVTSAYTKFVQGLAEGVYGPLQFVAQNMPGLIPDEYLDAIENDSEDIITTLLLTCNASSAAPTLILNSFVGTPGVIDPELTYLAAGYGGVVSGDQDTLYSALWQAYNNLQEFDSYDIANISCPVIGGMGTEDDLLGGQEEDFFSMLSPKTQEMSMLLTFDAQSGGALHDQVGSPLVLAAKQFAALNPIIEGLPLPRMSPSIAPSPATLPTLPTLPTATSG